MSLKVRKWRDHPRVCGEHYGIVGIVAVVLGSSPRMRGTLADQPQATPVDGIIPAYAGNTLLKSMRLPPFLDHPRVCGEHQMADARPQHAQGSSPRMRGTLVVIGPP